MTATTPAPTAARVKCHRCRRDFNIPLDTLRGLIDAGGDPDCGCRPVPAAKPRRARKRTRVDMILAAVASYEAAFKRPMPQADVVVSAWLANRKAFGLEGYHATYPSSNRVIMELVKMVARELLDRPAPKHYRVTPYGHKHLIYANGPGAA